MATSLMKIEGPLHPAPQEYPGFLRFLSRCYGFPNPRWFEDDAAHFFGPHPSQLKNNWVLKSGGHFVAHVGVFPFTALVGNKKLKVAGIGAVATDPEFRGRGLMKRLMDHVDQEMKRQGFDLSVLWGERALYRLFGYEQALFMDQFSFLKKHLKYFAAPKKVRPATAKDWPTLQRLYSAHPFRVQRTQAHLPSLLRRFTRKGEKPIWVLEEKGKVAAYTLFWRPTSFWKPAPGPLDVAEWGGSAEDVACLWSTVLQHDSADYMTATIYPGCRLYGWAMENNSNQTRISQSCMIKPLNLDGILGAFEPQLQERYSSLGSNAHKIFTLRTEDGQAISLEFGTKLRVRPAAGKGIPLELSLFDATQLLWGAGRPSEIGRKSLEGIGLLDNLFPLQWYWWRSDWI